MPVAIPLRTSRRDQVVDLTAEVRRVVADSGVTDGLCVVFCPHTTAGLVVNEGWDPAVGADLLLVLDRLVPQQGGDAHAEGNTAAHVKALTCGASQTLIVEGGRLVLGQWQAIQFYEFDGPRSRNVLVSVVESSR